LPNPRDKAVGGGGDTPLKKGNCGPSKKTISFLSKKQELIRGKISPSPL